MIYDSIDNILFYKNIDPNIYLGLEYLRNLSPDIPCGEYILSPSVKAIVSEYVTLDTNDNGFESHKDNVDIQFNLIGKEIITCYPVRELHISVPYNEESDTCFYFKDVIAPQNLLIGEKYFAIFFPQDGHMPKLKYLDGQGTVKKVVIKIKL